MVKSGVPEGLAVPVPHVTPVGRFTLKRHEHISSDMEIVLDASIRK
jgi:hypothetical protein